MEDGKWGHIEAGPSGKEWSGMVAQVGTIGTFQILSTTCLTIEAAWGDVHFVISDMFLTFFR